MSPRPPSPHAPRQPCSSDALRSHLSPSRRRAYCGIGGGCLTPPGVCSGCRTCSGVLGGPLKRVVGDLLPTILSEAVVGAPRELLVVGYGLGVAVVLGIGLVDRRRHEVVVAPRYEQQRCAILVPEVHVDVLVARCEVGEGPGPHEAARRRDVVALVDLV